MSRTPTYDAVSSDLGIDPAKIAARPAWSLEQAQKRLEQREKARAARRKRTERNRSREIPAQQGPGEESTTGRSTAGQASPPQ